MIQIKVLDAEKNIVAENGGQEEVNLTLRREYQEGDTIVFEIGGETGHYWMQVDDVLGKSQAIRLMRFRLKKRSSIFHQRHLLEKNSCFAFARQDLMRSIFIAIWQKMSTISMEM